MHMTNGDTEQMKFKERSRPGVFKRRVDHSLKLLLAGTNPKIDREKEGEFNAEVI